MIPISGYDLEVKVTVLEFSYKNKNICIYVYIAISSRPFDELRYPPIDRLGDIALSMESICPSVRLSVHKRIIVHPLTPNYPLRYFQETLSGCRWHLVGVLGTRMTSLTDLVHELSPLVSKNCKTFVRTIFLKHVQIFS